jgi:hypothetical protein
MALETFTAISLAGNILQFLDFGHKLLSEAREIHNSASGITAEVADVEQIATSLSQLADTLTAPVSTQLDGIGAQYESQIQDLARTSKKIADELLNFFGRLGRPNGRHTSWTSARQAIAGIWHKDKINKLIKRMEEVRNQLNAFILAYVRYEATEWSGLDRLVSTHIS